MKETRTSWGPEVSNRVALEPAVDNLHFRVGQASVKRSEKIAVFFGVGTPRRGSLLEYMILFETIGQWNECVNEAFAKPTSLQSTTNITGA